MFNFLLSNWSLIRLSSSLFRSAPRNPGLLLLDFLFCWEILTPSTSSLSKGKFFREILFLVLSVSEMDFLLPNSFVIISSSLEEKFDVSFEVSLCFSLNMSWLIFEGAEIKYREIMQTSFKTTLPVNNISEFLYWSLAFEQFTLKIRFSRLLLQSEIYLHHQSHTCLVWL